MTEEELRALFAQLEKEGLHPLLCDTPVPLYDAKVVCGKPSQSFEDCRDELILPRDLMSIHPEFTVTVRGDSMKGVGIDEGDVVKVVCEVVVRDGDIVLVSIDGESTIKTYCEDDEGLRWLVPQNEDYSPILLDDETNVRIIGRIAKIIKQAPRTSYKDCLKAIRKAKAQQLPKLTWQQVEAAIVEVSSMVRNGRQWYAVFRAMVDKRQIDKTDYEGFCILVARVVPSHEHLPNAGQMQRLAVQSFAKPVTQWDVNDAPVTNKPFYDYKRIAERMLELLTPGK